MIYMKKYGKIIAVIIGIIVVVALLLVIYFKVTFISKDEVKDIVISNMNVNSSDVHFESIELELDKNYYEVELYYQNNDYEYKIDAKSGKVVYSDFISNSNLNSNNGSNGNGNGNNNSQGQYYNNAKITLQEARDLAYNHANVDVNMVVLKKCSSEIDDNKLIYEIEFTYNNYEYDYKIDAATGEIIDFDKDNIHN